MSHLCITVKWLDDRYHGMLDRGGPGEWPPSPFRLLQALVAGVARRGELGSPTDALPEWMQWLEKLDPPVIIAPNSFAGQIVTRFVPNNDGDKIPDRQNRLTGKTSRPLIMMEPPEIHYLWLVSENAPEIEQAMQASRCLSCFGWGIDMAYADARLLDDLQIGTLKGTRWLPKPDTLRDYGLLRVPVEGTVADLRRAHQSALNRIEHGKPLRTVDKPQVFDRVLYTGSERPIGRPYEVFALRNDKGDFFTYPHAKLIHIAGMTRCVAIKAMRDYPPPDLEKEKSDTWIENCVAGHRSAGLEDHKQFSYVPLPSIGSEHADAMIRRVMIMAPFGDEAHLRHLAEQLDGEQLIPEGGGEKPILERLKSDGVTHAYVNTSTHWASVTPVILPGHDDHKPAKTEKLIQKALLQSGIDQPCKFTWSAIPNFKNCLSAHKYDQHKRHVGYYRPNHLEQLTAIHIRLTFDHPVTGPICIGAGRHCGLGVFASIRTE
jgi:CRISPR-associated protein Csb2